MTGTGIRNRHKVGDYLMKDDESGFTEYASNMIEQWDGTYRRDNEPRNPQEFLQARADPEPLSDIRPEGDLPASDNTVPTTIGETSVPFVIGPANHIFD